MIKNGGKRHQRWKSSRKPCERLICLGGGCVGYHVLPPPPPLRRSRLVILVWNYRLPLMNLKVKRAAMGVQWRAHQVLARRGDVRRSDGRRLISGVLKTPDQKWINWLYDHGRPVPVHVNLWIYNSLSKLIVDDRILFFRNFFLNYFLLVILISQPKNQIMIRKDCRIGEGNF